MKGIKIRLYIAVIMQLFMLPCYGQETRQIESLLEARTENPNEVNGEDEYQLDMEPFHSHPLDLNKATGTDLEKLHLLTTVQISRLLHYRELFGPFLNIYELQAVPGWDPLLLQKLKPYIKVDKAGTSFQAITGQLKEGSSRLVFRYVRILEKSAGYFGDSAGVRYPGSPEQLQLRYLIRFKKEWQAGFLGEKDAGETLFRKSRSKGFDFNSFHLFARDHGKFRALALGDFTASMGQGLVQWQGMGTGRSSEVMMISKREGILRPYQSAGEFSFFRGAGITFSVRKTEATLFASIRKKDANLVRDSTGHPLYFSSWNSSGLHRTETEYADRHQLSEAAAGGVLSRNWKTWKFSLNAVYYRYGLPVQKRNEPYNIYTWRGREWYNGSFSWSGNTGNMHLFGEMAVDKKKNRALLAGLVMSVDPKVDLAVLYRDISPQYQVISGNALTAGSLPVNEKGVYMALCFRPAMGWTCSFYADLFRFPWLKYNVDAPSVGSEYFIELKFTPDKLLELYSRYRYSGNEGNEQTSMGLPGLAGKTRSGWRTQISYKLNRDLALRARVEMSLFRQGKAETDHGFLWFTDCLFKPLGKPYSAIFRAQFFDTDSYDSRIYAYENDVLYSYSLPGFSGKGAYCLILLTADAGRNVSFWVRYGRQVAVGNGGIGTGADRISGNHRSELKIEARWLF